MPTETILDRLARKGVSAVPRTALPPRLDRGVRRAFKSRGPNGPAIPIRGADCPAPETAAVSKPPAVNTPTVSPATPTPHPTASR